MTSDKWFSPVRILDSALLGTKLEIVQGNSVKSPVLTVTVGLNIEHPDEDDSMRRGECVFSFNGVWHDPDDQEEVAFRIDCTMGMTIGIPESAFDEGFPRDRIERYVDANAVSLVYGKIRSFVEDLTSQTSIGRQTIPAIDPNALLNALGKSSSASNAAN